MIRPMLVALVLLGVVGLSLELLLLDHYESFTQLIPFGVLAAGLFTGGWLLRAPARRSVLAFGVVMALFVGVGVLGLYLHWAGNRAFELEMEPGTGGWLLAWRSLRGATPSLAPGAMIQAGLVGLIAIYRHPALDRTTRSRSGDRTEREEA